MNKFLIFKFYIRIPLKLYTVKYLIYRVIKKQQEVFVACIVQNVTEFDSKQFQFVKKK